MLTSAQSTGTMSHARVMQDSHCLGMSRKQNNAPAKLRTLAAAGMRCTLMTVPLAEADASSVPSWFHARTTCELAASVSVLTRNMHVHADMHQAYTAPGHVKGGCAICTAAKMVVCNKSQASSATTISQPAVSTSHMSAVTIQTPNHASHQLCAGPHGEHAAVTICTAHY